MDERLIKQWEVTEKLLREAAAELSTDPILELEDDLAHNELELALDALIGEASGRDPQPSSSFWRLLKQAADVMGLARHRNELRHHFRAAIARESASAPRT
jgi:hypothetical protein